MGVPRLAVRRAAEHGALAVGTGLHPVLLRQDFADPRLRMIRDVPRAAYRSPTESYEFYMSLRSGKCSEP